MILSSAREVQGFFEYEKNLVTTNGCFDILHAGHVHGLYHIRRHTRGLYPFVILVNSDESIQRLKGDKRPVIGLAWRMALLEELHIADFIVPFYEDTPCEALDILRPDMHFKGEEYKNKDMPEREIVESHGGEIRFIPKKYDISTTIILERLA